jgi:uncharacterized membrane protein YbaN (DUF454 family)
MFKRLTRKWHRLRDSRPGTRFRNYYRRTRRDKNRDEGAPRIARLLLSLALFMVGICLLFFPLIYLPFFIASAALLASESLKFARFLDRGESWIRATGRRFRRKHGLSRRTISFMKLTVGVGCLVLSGIMCYNAFVR